MYDYRSMFDMTGKTALVVGAGSGIGEAASHGLAAFGAKVFCADVDVDAAEQTAEAARAEGWEAEAVELDMTDPGSVRAAGERVGTPDALVSTPSINVRKPLLDITDDEFDRIIDLNLKGTFRLCRQFGRGMAERGSGKIVNLASIAAGEMRDAVRNTVGGHGGVEEGRQGGEHGQGRIGVAVVARCGVAPAYEAADGAVDVPFDTSTSPFAWAARRRGGTRTSTSISTSMWTCWSPGAGSRSSRSATVTPRRSLPHSSVKK